MISERVINRINGVKRRIRERHTDDNGKEHIKTYDCEQNADVDALMVANAVEIEANVAQGEAEEASEESGEVSATTHADIKTVALAFLRKAMDQSDSYEAYRRFDKFNTYRNNQGWTLTQVVSNLAEVGLTQDEWDDMSARYVYLSDAQRVTVMENYQTVLTGDIWSDN